MFVRRGVQAAPGQGHVRAHRGGGRWIGLHSSSVPHPSRRTPGRGALLRQDRQRPGHRHVHGAVRGPAVLPHPKRGQALRQIRALLYQTPGHRYFLSAPGDLGDVQEVVYGQTLQK